MFFTNFNGDTMYLTIKSIFYLENISCREVNNYKLRSNDAMLVSFND